MSATAPASDAFALAYLPAVCGFLPANLGIVETVAREPHDEALGHALGFSRKALPLAAGSPKSSGPSRLAEVAARSGVTLSPLPSVPAEVEAWIKTSRESAYTVLGANADETRRAAFLTGLPAGDLHCGLRIVANVIYLRCAAPEQPFLRQRAIGIAGVVRDATQRLQGALDRPGVPAAVAQIGTRLAAQLAKTPDIVAATDHAAYAKYNEWVAPLWDLLNELGPAFEKTS